MKLVAYQSREAQHVKSPRHPKGYHIEPEWAVRVVGSGLIVKRFDTEVAAKGYAAYENSKG